MKFKGKKMEMISENFTWKQFDKAIVVLTQKIKDCSRLSSLTGIYGIPRGGLIPAVALSHKLKLPLITDADRVDLNILVVDDISDTGITLKTRWTMNITATIHYAPETTYLPDFFYAIRNSDWIIYPWEK